MRYTLETAHWRVPSAERAFDGWLEGARTPEQRAATLAEVARKRGAWVPSEGAWSQLRDLECFIARRVRIQFWDKIMCCKPLIQTFTEHQRLSRCLQNEFLALLPRRG
jgi:hypothetical protein